MNTRKIDVASLRDRVENLTKQADELKEQLAQQAEALTEQLRTVRGTRDKIKPATEYHVGDDGPTGDLMTSVQRLLTERPMSFRELLDMTGARDNRVKGVIMRLQREGVDVVNLGTEQRALWFIPNPELLKRLRSRRGTGSK